MEQVKTVKTVKTRIQHKHDIEANWIKATHFAPLAGELIIYDAETSSTDLTGTGRTEPIPYVRFKFGDGTTPITDLAFSASPVDWNQNDPQASDYIKNRTHYVDSQGQVVQLDAKYIPLDNETIVTDDNGKLKANVSSTISGTVTQSIGGIDKGTTYDNTDIVTVLEELLFPYVAPSDLSITTIAESGIFEYGTKFTITTVTPKFTKGSREITSIKIGTSKGGEQLYSGETATSGTAIALKTLKAFDGSTNGNIYCTISDGTSSVDALASVSYKYYDYSKLTTSTTPATSGATKQASSGADATYEYTAGQYLWLYSRSSGKKIQQYISGTWADVDTYGGSSLTLTLSNGTTATYYAYRTDKFTANGEARYRLA